MIIVDVQKLIQELEAKASELLFCSALEGKINNREDVTAVVLPFFKSGLQDVLRKTTDDDEAKIEEHLELSINFQGSDLINIFYVKTLPLTESGELIHNAFHHSETGVL